MLVEKKPFSIEEIEAQAAFELPERETPTLVAIGCVAACTGGDIIIQVENNQVAAQVCAQVQAITTLTGAVLSCNISK